MFSKVAQLAQFSELLLIKISNVGVCCLFINVNFYIIIVKYCNFCKIDSNCIKLVGKLRCIEVQKWKINKNYRRIMSESRNLLINLSFVSLSKKYFIFVQITFRLGVKFAKKKNNFRTRKVMWGPLWDVCSFRSRMLFF